VHHLVKVPRSGSSIAFCGIHHDACAPDTVRGIELGSGPAAEIVNLLHDRSAKSANQKVVLLASVWSRYRFKQRPLIWFCHPVTVTMNASTNFVERNLTDSESAGPGTQGIQSGPDLVNRLNPTRNNSWPGVRRTSGHHKGPPEVLAPGPATDGASG
jgi:hypothetical protein